MTGSNQPISRAKLSAIFFLAIILNCAFIFSMVTGAKALKHETGKNSEEISELSRHEFHYVTQKLASEFMNNQDDEPRVDDPVILSYQNLYDATHYDLSLSFDIPKK